MPTLAALDFTALSVPERIDLISDIWDSIAEETPNDEIMLTEADKAELHRRLAAHRTDPSSAIPWEKVRAELLGEPG